MNILDTLKSLDGYWKYEDGKYLAKLTSGKVSDTYVNCSVLTSRPYDLGKACEVLKLKFEDFAYISSVGERYPNLYVCGPSMGGITLAYEMGRQLGATAIFTEPKYTTIPNPHAIGVEKIGQQLKRFEIPDGASVLFVEDVITTGKSTGEMISAIWKATERNVNVLPYVLCLVNRSGRDTVWTLTKDDGSEMPDNIEGYCWHKEFKIISLADVQARTWATVEEARAALCVKCDAENNPPEVVERNEMNVEIRPFLMVEAVRPKENWDLLTGKETL